MSSSFLVIAAATILQVLTADTGNPDNPGDGDKPLVTFIPDWRKLFYNETLTIACLGGKGQQKYTWYRNNNKMDTNEQNFTIASIQLYDRANYQCQVGNGAISEPARQQVITDLAILRVPRYVFEGDILILKCDSRLDVNNTNAEVSFNKLLKLQKGKTTESSLFIGKADKSISGKYSCKKEAYLNDVKKSSEDSEQIDITELFSSPELNINPNPIQVGSDMTLTCATKLHPLRATTELQFAFYRNGWHIQGFSSANTLKIPSVTLEDSGDYACEVQTSTTSVRKMSKPISIQVHEVEKPEVIFNPNVDKILRTERIELSCVTSRFSSPSTKYSWYKNNNLMYATGQSYTIYGAGDNDIGNYQCQKGSGEKSDPVHLDVFFVWLILQAPNSIHEGDPVILTCKMWRSGVAKNTTFYKDDKVIKFVDNLWELNLGLVSKETSGKYKCTRYINTGSASKVYTAEEFISVAELFSPPEVKVSPYSMIEGADMTLTCHTVLSPRRRFTELHFTFYKDGQIVQNVGKSDKYQVQSVKPEDSGNYTCKVQNVMATVSKTSSGTLIQIQGMAVVAFTPNVGKILSGESMTLACNVDSNMKGDQTFYWYKDNDKIKETQQRFTIQSASVNDSGYYQCRSSVTHLSDPVRLDVSNSDLILQAPPVITEGDDLTLSCHHNPAMDFSWVEILKDGSFLKTFDGGSDLKLGKANRNMTGAYRCTKRRKTSPYASETYIADTFVYVKELFPYLQVRVSQDMIVQGDDIVLSCETALSSALSPLRGKTELQFAFYKDGANVQRLSTNDKYKISSIQDTHSGNYTCEVKSMTNSVTKMSQPLGVDVQDLFSTPNFYVNANMITQGESLILSCETNLNSNRSSTSKDYVFYRDGKSLSNPKWSSRFRIWKVSEDDMGEYHCEVSSTNMVKKSNAITVTVQVPILDVKITMDQNKPDLTSGESVTFRCSAEHGTAPSYTWLHNDKELVQNCVLYNISQEGRVLFINSTQPQHSGTYQCQVKNSFSGVKSQILRINVTEPATIAAHSEPVKCSGKDNNNPYVVPVLIVVAIGVILTVAAVYRYRHRLPIRRFTFHKEQIIVSRQQDEDSLLSLENMDTIERFSNSHH